MDTSASPRILIVGAGPCGHTLALALLRNGILVRFIEKSPTPNIGQRGPGIMPRTLELFHFLGVLDRVYEKAIPVPQIRVYAPQQGFAVPLKTFHMSKPLDPTPSLPIRTPACIGQNLLESVLRTVLKEDYGCEVEFGSELVSLTQDADGVDATILHRSTGREEVTRFDYVVGTDGARGIVRKLLGLSFRGESRPEVNLIIGDIHIDGATSDGEMNGDCLGNPVVLQCVSAADGNPGLVALFMGTTLKDDYERLTTDQGALQTAIRNITGVKDLVVREVAWISQWKANIRMVDKFRDGRCFVAGDAAHIHSPTGGQGLNSSAHDAFNLGWKLALVQRGLAPESLLDSYNQERLPVVTEMLAATTQLLNRSVRATNEDVSHWDRGGPLFMLGVNYRWSPFVLDERFQGEEKIPADAYGVNSTDLRAGDRAPDAPGLKDFHSGKTGLRLFDVFDAARHTVLVFAAAPERYAGIMQVLARVPRDAVRCVIIVRGMHVDIRGPDMILDDTLGHAYSIYDVGDWNTVVVRPDGVIGAVVKSCQALERYFETVFL